jgi:phage portal protein BeeE
MNKTVRKNPGCFLFSLCKGDGFLARFFSRFRSRDKPVNRTAGSSFTFYMGGSSSGKYVNERSAMQMTAVYACVRILSEAVAGLPLHLYRYNDSGGKEKKSPPVGRDESVS